ncbi:hypothetical protein C4D60_Mb04t35880 [Musa balbisiana]|uniref:Uncharacterized protein n=1 Tax=Musa balbisiana TaxID=52838 RepID=A0A4S8KH28_MUSBA|nr:hypothetical protein C4D60_Mb04t35880 [Musa balbisiana]
MPVASQDTERSNLDDGHLSSKGQYHPHLQQNAKSVPYIVRVKLLEALGAVSPLKQEGPPDRSLREPLLQPPRLPCEHQRRVRLQAPEDRLQLLLIRVRWDLERPLRLPTTRRPTRGRCRLPSRGCSRDDWIPGENGDFGGGRMATDGNSGGREGDGGGEIPAGSESRHCSVT